MLVTTVPSHITTVTVPSFEFQSGKGGLIKSRFISPPVEFVKTYHNLASDMYFKLEFERKTWDCV
jgi:hypothetical protein